MTDDNPPGFLAAVTKWLRETGEPLATAVTVKPYGTDWDGDTEGGFYSSFEVTINFIREDDSRGTRWPKGEEMESLWTSVVAGYERESAGTDE